MEILIMFLACFFIFHLIFIFISLVEDKNPITSLFDMYSSLIRSIKEHFELREYKKEIRELNKEIEAYKKIEKMQLEKIKLECEIEYYKEKYN
ncbi:MAG TPA: hypothetical protein VIG40_00640 [Tissierellaceae bacterium]